VEDDDKTEIYDEAFAYERTISRLKEMQSEYYFQKKHKYLLKNEITPEV
jgi:predicted ATPase